MRFIIIGIMFFTAFFASAQRQEHFRGSIPEELLRPGRGESARYPMDMVIGEIGQGAASEAAYSFANSVGSALLSGRHDHPVLASVNSALLESYISSVRGIEAGAFRIGSGREEADGSVSFIIRFIGRDHGMIGELFIRRSQGSAGWVFDELILEEARSREEEMQKAAVRSRFDFSPYERFY